MESTDWRRCVLIVMEALFYRISSNSLYVSSWSSIFLLPGDRYTCDFWLDTLGMFWVSNFVLGILCYREDVFYLILKIIRAMMDCELDMRIQLFRCCQNLCNLQSPSVEYPIFIPLFSHRVCKIRYYSHS